MNNLKIVLLVMLLISAQEARAVAPPANFFRRTFSSKKTLKRLAYWTFLVIEVKATFYIREHYMNHWDWYRLTDFPPIHLDGPWPMLVVFGIPVIVVVLGSIWVFAHEEDNFRRRLEQRGV